MNYQYIPVTQTENSTDLYRQQQMRRRRAAACAHRRRAIVARQRRTLAFTAFALVLGVILAVSVLSTSTLATGADRASTTYKYYKEVYVESGDTLWNIAAQYTDGSISEIQECITEICSINDLSRLETLKSGTYIVVPYYSSQYLQ
ncbi:MAG: LysM peptidoglycan-binding domain-containing protein [Lachnospiraceae bacterium]|nr:LysM peptidoglycan-binding domain-containing protein [Lachnospiraceae bacterium]